MTNEDKLRRLVGYRPESKEELWLYYKAAFGMGLVRESVCEAHSSQLDFAWEMVRGGAGNIIALACRHGGKTSTAAASTLVRAVTQPDLDGFVMSGCVAPWQFLVVQEGGMVYCKPLGWAKAGDVVWTKEGWRKVKAVMVKPGIEEFSRLRTAIGDITTTGDHLIYIKDAIDGDRKWVPAKDIGRLQVPLVPTRGADGSRLLPSDENSTLDPYLAGVMAGLPVDKKRSTSEMLYVRWGWRAPVGMKSKKGLAWRAEREKASCLGALGYAAKILKGVGVYLHIYECSGEKEGSFSTTVPVASIPRAYLEQDIRWYWRYDREWRRRFLEAFFAVAFRKTSYGKAGYFRRNAGDAIYFRARGLPQIPDLVNEPLWRQEIAKASIILLLSLDVAELWMIPTWPKFPTWMPYSSQFPALVWFRPGSSIPITDMPFRSAVFKDSTLYNPVLIEPAPSEVFIGRAGIKDKRKRGDPSVFFDLEIEGADNFMILPGCIVHNSKRQARRFYQFFEKMSRKSWFEDDFDGRPEKEEVRFKTGSRVEILATSETSARSPHGNLIIADEADAIPSGVYESLNFAVDLTDEISDRRALFVITSTQHRLGGNISRLLERLEEQGSKHTRVFRWCMREVIAPCPRDAVCANCDLFNDCGGVAKEKQDGFLTREKLVSLKERLVSKDAWDREMMLKPPRAGDTACPLFRDGFPYVYRFDAMKTLPSFHGWDFGVSTAIVFANFDEKKQRVFVFDERLIQHKDHQHVVDVVNRIDAYHRLPNPKSFGDPHGGQDILTYARLGHVILSYMGRRKQSRLDVLNWFMEYRDDGKPGIAIHPRCKQLRHELIVATRGDLIQYDPVSKKRLVVAKEGFHILNALIYLLDGIYMGLDRSREVLARERRKAINASLGTVPHPNWGKGKRIHNEGSPPFIIEPGAPPSLDGIDEGLDLNAGLG